MRGTTVTPSQQVKSPQSAAQRKAAQRARLKAQGFVMVKFPETWVTPEQAKKIEYKTAQVIAGCAAIKGNQNAK